MATSSKRVEVFVRTRPTPSFAQEAFDFKNKTVTIRSPHRPEVGLINNTLEELKFGVDAILHNSSQEEVYSVTTEHIVSDVLAGINGTVFTYGQTGAGKTYTMIGGTNGDQYRLRGIIPRTISQIFKQVRETEDSSIIVRISYLEIYNEVLSDLLSTLPHAEQRDCLSLSEDEKGCIYVKGLSVRLAENEEEALNMLFEGEKNRLVGEHSLNKISSRSHVIFTMYVEVHSSSSASAQYTVSKLNLVDLAGSERIGKTESTGTTLKEAIYINKSLTYLEQVILALADRQRQHVPYRQCKLTHVLRDSLQGNCATVMIANIWGELAHIEETIATLRFASRIMSVVTYPHSNVCYHPEGLLQKYQQEIKTLKEELAVQSLLHHDNKSGDQLTQSQVIALQRDVKLYMEGTLSTLEFNSIRDIKEIFSQFKQYTHSIEEYYKEKLSTLQEKVDILEHKLATENVPSTDVGEEPKTIKPTLKGGRFGVRKSITVSPSPGIEEPEREEHAYSDGQGISIAKLSSHKLPSAVASKRKISFMPKMSISDSQKKKSTAGDGFGGEMEFCVDDDSKSLQPSSPPSRFEAFELFKKGRGKELNKVFLQNKELLQRKRKEAYNVSCSLNQLKGQIDHFRKTLQEKKVSRIDHGTLQTSSGQLVLDSEEYEILVNLQKAKDQYKAQYSVLEGLQIDIPRCDHYTQLSRQRLLKEFDLWYKLAFIGEGNDIQHKDGGEHQLQSTETHSHFNSIQQVLLKADPATNAFYGAQLRTKKRSIGFRRPTGIMTFQ